MIADDQAALGAQPVGLVEHLEVGAFADHVQERQRDEQRNAQSDQGADVDRRAGMGESIEEHPRDGEDNAVGRAAQKVL